MRKYMSKSIAKIRFVIHRFPDHSPFIIDITEYDDGAFTIDIDGGDISRNMETGSMAEALAYLPIMLVEAAGTTNLCLTEH